MLVCVWRKCPFPREGLKAMCLDQICIVHSNIPKLVYLYWKCPIWGQNPEIYGGWVENSQFIPKIVLYEVKIWNAVFDRATQD